MVVKTEKNVEGVIRLLTEDLSPSIEFKIMVGVKREGMNERITTDCELNAPLCTIGSIFRTVF